MPVFTIRYTGDYPEAFSYQHCHSWRAENGDYVLENLGYTETITRKSALPQPDTNNVIIQHTNGNWYRLWRTRVEDSPKEVIEYLTALGFDMRNIVVERYRNKSWRDREKLRRPLPWSQQSEIAPLPPIPDHFAHISTTNPELIAYTQSPDKGELNIQTPIKPGRYLTKFYPNLSPDEVRKYASMIRKPEVSFARTEDDIEAVYRGGPKSCMSKALYKCAPYHPTAVYASEGVSGTPSDLAIAYLGDMDDATARCVVWPEKLIYGPIYGDFERLDYALKLLGYRKAERRDFDGAKLRKIETNNYNYVMPYLDIGGVNKCKGYFEVAAFGDYAAEHTDGLLRYQMTCEHCEDELDENDYQTVRTRNGEENWCQYCLESHTFWCAGMEEYYSDSDFGLVEIDHQYYEQTYAEMNGAYLCEATENWYWQEDDAMVYLEDTSKTVCLSWAEQNAYHMYDAWYENEPEGWAEYVKREAA